MTDPESTSDWLHDERPIRRVHLRDDAAVELQTWPASVPAVRSFLEGLQPEGWEFSPGVTFLVGENGSGKSTLIEGIAEAFGLPAEGGTTNGGFQTRRTESPLGEWLRVERGPMGPRFGFFLRAETMHSYYTWLEDLPGPGVPLHRMSHGESFNALLGERLDHQQFVMGLACLDEPVETALEAAGVRPSSTMVGHNVGAVAGLVASGLGVTVVPGLVRLLMEFAQLDFVPLRPVVEREISMVRRSDEGISAAAERFMMALGRRRPL